MFCFRLYDIVWKKNIYLWLWLCCFQFTIQLAVCGFAEFVLHLTRMNPDMMYLHRDSGFLNIAYFKLDIDDQTGTDIDFLFII